MFSHPAYVCAYFAEPDVKSDQNWFINKKVLSDYPKFTDARRAKQFHVALTFIDPSHRLPMFMRLIDEIEDDDEYWRIVHFVLESQPHGYPDSAPWLKIFRRKANPSLKTDLFQRLPEMLTVYQAGGPFEFGTSAMRWTLNKSLAEAEVAKYGACNLKIGTVEKSKILYIHQCVHLYMDSRSVKVEKD